MVGTLWDLLIGSFVNFVIVVLVSFAKYGGV